MNRSRTLLAAACAGALLSPAVTADAAPERSPLRRYIVFFDQGVDSAATTATHRTRFGLEPPSSFDGGYGLWSTDRLASRIRSMPGVAEVRPELMGQVSAGPMSVPDPDPSEGQRTPRSITRVGGQSSTAVSGNGTGAVGVRVVVIDSGVDPAHLDLNVIGGKNCAVGIDPGDTNVGHYHDVNGHGTFVAGLIAARDNTFDSVGVAPGAPIYSVRITGMAGTFYESNLICGLQWAEGAAPYARVVNMSIARMFGDFDIDGRQCGLGEMDYSMVHDEICDMFQAGQVMVAAAGNTPPGGTSWDFRGVSPAAYNEVITVAAMTDYNGTAGGGAPRPPECDPMTNINGTDADDKAAKYSYWTSRTGDDRNHVIAAPGTCIVSLARGGGRSLEPAGGTSFAAPIVSGVVLLCLQSGRCVGMSPTQIRQTINADAAAQPQAYSFMYSPWGPLGDRSYGHLVRAASF